MKLLSFRMFSNLINIDWNLSGQNFLSEIGCLFIIFQIWKMLECHVYQYDNTYYIWSEKSLMTGSIGSDWVMVETQVFWIWFECTSRPSLMITIYFVQINFWSFWPQVCAALFLFWNLKDEIWQPVYLMQNLSGCILEEAQRNSFLLIQLNHYSTHLQGQDYCVQNRCFRAEIQYLQHSSIYLH